MRHEKIIPNKNYPFKAFEFYSQDTERLILPHWHTSGELLLCIDGILEIKYPENTYTVRKNELFFINSNIIHSTNIPLPSHVFVVQMPLNFIQECTGEAYGNSIYFEKILSDNESLRRLIADIYLLYKIDTVISRLLVLSRIYEIFAILLESYTIPTLEVKEISSVKYLDQLDQVNQYIKQNYQRNLSLNEVAERFNYNASYFSRYYKKFMGISFVNYLQSVRLDKAYTLLRDTDLTILTISNECGFGNVKSFYLVFKEAYHLSPKQYRQRYLK